MRFMFGKRYLLVSAGLFAAIHCFGQAAGPSAFLSSASGEKGFGPTLQTPANSDQAPEAVTLQDALARAQKIYSPYLSTVTDARLAHEDYRQARNGMLPSISYHQEYLGTEGNGKPPTGAMSPMMAFMFTGPGESFVRIFRPVSSPEHHTSALPPLLQSRMQRQKLPGAGWWLRSPRLSIRWLRRRESTPRHSRADRSRSDSWKTPETSNGEAK